MIKKKKIWKKNGGGCLMTNGHLIANKLVYSHLTSIFMCIHIWHWFLSEWLYWICLYLILITKICFSHEMNVFTNKTKKCVHKICMNITQLNVHSVMFTWRKKKVKLSYNNISIHLGAENTEVYCLKFIKKKQNKNPNIFYQWSFL